MHHPHPRYQRLLALFALDLLTDFVLADQPDRRGETVGETEEERIDRIAGELLADVDISFA